MKKFLLFILILFCSNLVRAQFLNEFEKGFNVGFKQGYCYDKNVTCLPPLTPLPPLPSINESVNSFQDGYNRGFLVGKSVRDYDDNTKYNFTPNIYKGYVEPVKPNNYQGSVDLGLMAIVLQYKQSLFDARFGWVQQRINDLYSLNYSLLYKKDREIFDINKKWLDNDLQILNSPPGFDLSDDNVFNSLAMILSNVEQGIIKSAIENR